MKILVTGGSGYFGSVLVPKLQALGHSIMIQDLLSPHVEYDSFMQTNLTWGRVYELDVCIHLAGLRYEECEDTPDWAYEVNVAVTKKVAEAYDSSEYTSKLGPPLIFASSCSVLNPNSVYALTKLGAEKFILDAGGVVLRFGTMCGYSPNMRLDTLANQFAVEKEIKLYEPFSFRPFVHVEDAAEAVIASITHKEMLRGRPWLVTSDNVQKQELADFAKKEFGADVEVIKEGDARNYNADAKEFKRVARWTPYKTVFDGMREVHDKCCPVC